MIRPEDVKRLREQTGAGIMDCKRALEDSAGDVEKAIAWLRDKGLSVAAKKAGPRRARGRDRQLHPPWRAPWASCSS